MNLAVLLVPLIFAASSSSSGWDSSSSGTPPPQIKPPAPKPPVVCSIGVQCPKVGDSCTQTLTRPDGATLTSTYTCMACSDITPELPGPKWMPVQAVTSVPGKLCGADLEIDHKVETTTYKTDPHGQCRMDLISTSQVSKSEYGETKIDCAGDGCGSSSSTSEEGSAGSGSSSAAQPTPTPCGNNTITLSCMILSSNYEQRNKDGYVWVNGRGWIIPPGGQNGYYGTKSTADSIDESTQCPDPYRKLGRQSCSVTGDAARFGLRCP